MMNEYKRAGLNTKQKVLSALVTGVLWMGNPLSQPGQYNGLEDKVSKYEVVQTASAQNQRVNEYGLEIMVQKSPSYTPGRKSEIEGVVIHSTEGSGKGALVWLTRKGGKSSAHYIVMENGNVIRMVEDKDTAWHAGPKANPGYIGIEFAGFAHKPGAKFTDAQYASAGRLVDGLIKKYGIKPEKVVSHDHVSKNLGGTNHSDPGPNFDWNTFRKYAGYSSINSTKLASTQSTTRPTTLPSTRPTTIPSTLPVSYPATIPSSQPTTLPTTYRGFTGNELARPATMPATLPNVQSTQPATQEKFSEGPKLRRHIIQEGDTAWELAGVYNVPFNVIVKSNSGIDFNNLKIGSELNIPINGN